LLPGVEESKEQEIQNLNKLFIKNLPLVEDEAKLKGTLQEVLVGFGPIASVDIIKTKFNISLSAIVTFTDPKAVSSAIEKREEVAQN